MEKDIRIIKAILFELKSRVTYLEKELGISYKRETKPASSGKEKSIGEISEEPGQAPASPA